MGCVNFVVDGVFLGESASHVMEGDYLKLEAVLLFWMALLLSRMAFLLWTAFIMS